MRNNISFAINLATKNAKQWRFRLIIISLIMTCLKP